MLKQGRPFYASFFQLGFLGGDEFMPATPNFDPPEFSALLHEYAISGPQVRLSKAGSGFPGFGRIPAKASF
jgi:hypothetical protein